MLYKCDCSVGWFNYDQQYVMEFVKKSKKRNK